MHCDICGRKTASVVALGRDGNGEPDAPDACASCARVSAEPWPCVARMSATMPDRRTRTVVAYYDGSGDAVGKALAAFRQRLRKPWLWYGCDFHITTPLGQRASGVFEE